MYGKRGIRNCMDALEAQKMSDASHHFLFIIMNNSAMSFYEITLGPHVLSITQGRESTRLTVHSQSSESMYDW